MGHPGNSRSAAQSGLTVGEVGVGVTGSEVWRRGSGGRLIGWTGTMREGDVLAGLPFEPRELAGELCLSILGPAYAESVL